MKAENISFEKIEEYTTTYKQRTTAELSVIKPTWAVGRYQKHLKDLELNPFNGSYTIYSVAPESIIKNADFLEVETDTLFNGLSNNDFRITRLLYRWENGYFVDPPSVSMSDSKKILQFCDGRHRTKLAYLLKFKTMPIAILNKDISNIKDLIKIKPI